MPYITEENITEIALSRWSTGDDPRTAELLTALVRHLHAFAREVRLTEDEWAAAIQWLVRAGKISDEKREDFVLASDVLGQSMLVVQMNNNFDPAATPATVLGPFHLKDSPHAEYGADMSDGLPGAPLYIHGVVRDVDGKPVGGAVLDVWQADSEGLYESQLKDVDEARLRAKYTSRADGSYCLQSIVPFGYGIPNEGPVRELVNLTAMSTFRPAHVHFLIEAPGYERLITHLFREGTPHLDDDVVYGVKEELVVNFVENEPGPTPNGRESADPFITVEYDFVLQPRA
jgi:hydroxyquinol 1,2-dioxygenase